MNVVANNPYIESIQTVIQKLHGCASTWVEAVPVHEVFRGQTVWKGDVEVFNIAAHPKAKRCYAWAERKNQNDPGAKFFTVLEIPPVISAKTAVQAGIVGDSKSKTS